MLERGVRMPSILVAKQVAEALGTSMGTLLTEVDDDCEAEERMTSPGRRDERHLAVKLRRE